jgi:hypothetical protein
VLTKIALFKVDVPYNILSFSILAKLNKNLWSVVNNIIRNEAIIENPQATLTKLQEILHLEESQKSKSKTTSSTTKTTKDQPESASALRHKSKKGKRKAKSCGTICKDGKHNPLTKSHNMACQPQSTLLLSYHSTFHVPSICNTCTYLHMQSSMMLFTFTSCYLIIILSHFILLSLIIYELKILSYLLITYLLNTYLFYT